MHGCSKMAQQQELDRCRRDPAVCIGEYGMIRHPLRGAIPFALWDWQREVLQYFQQEKRVIILKARQLGASELAAAYALWLARFHRGVLILIISRNHTEASELLERAAFMQDHFPDWLRAAPVKRGASASDGVVLLRRTARILEFGHPQPDAADSDGYIPSRIESMPATRSTGRSRAVTLAILDEWAHQPWQDAIWTAMQPTVATGGSVIGLSTANGMGNLFHRLWQGARIAAIGGVQRDAVTGTNGFTGIFLPWHVHPERDHVWYAEQQRALEPWQLHQEYPAIPADAFVQSGRPVFDSVYLRKHAARINAQTAPLEDHDGETIWFAPAANAETGRYIIGADVAEGLAHGDFDAACIIDRQTGQQVAALRGRWPVEEYAKRLAALGLQYNTALLAVERNQHGHAVLLALREQEYPNLYYYSDPLRTALQQESRPGWPTTARTKPMIIAHLANGLREGSYQPADITFVSEALAFAYHANGSLGAPNGLHDDTIIAHAIAWYLASQPDQCRSTLTLFASLAQLHDHTAQPEDEI